MDPLTALALTCNVLQLVEFSIQSAKCCRELYQAGSLNNHNVIAQYTASIKAVNDEVEQALKQQKIVGKPTRLQLLAQEASAAAAELRTTLNTLKLSKAQGNRKPGGAFKTTLKVLIKNGKLEKLQQKLEIKEKALQSCLLKDLYDNAQSIRDGQNNLARREELEKLSQGNQDIINNFLEGQKLASAKIIQSVDASEKAIAIRLKGLKTNS